MNIKEMFVELITDMSFAKNRTPVTYQGKNEQELEWGQIGNGVSNETLPPYPLSLMLYNCFRIKQ